MPSLKVQDEYNKSVQVKVSPHDKNAYRHIVLSNGLEVLLVHDAETDTVINRYASSFLFLLL